VRRPPRQRRSADPCGYLIALKSHAIAMRAPSLRRPGIQILVSVVLACAAGGRAVAQPVEVAAAAAPIELPKFQVTDSRVLPPPESWRYASIPGFEILSSVSARETTRFVKDFFLLQEGINAIMPGFRPNDVAVPTSLILIGRGNGFDRFLPADREEERMRTNSVFFDDPERGAIIVDFALTELLLEDNTTEEADPYRGFYKEYFRYLIKRQMGSKPPPWFEEGLVQLFASIDVTKKWINFAQIGDGFGGPRTGDFNRILVQRGLMTFPEMFSDPPVQRGTIWSAQCYGFVHMCLYGRGQIYQKAFAKFVSRIANEAPNEGIFKECFGKTYKEMAMELRGYVDFTDYKAMQYTAKKGQSLPDPPPFTLRDATEAESGRIVGEALRLGAHGAAAHLALIAPYIRGERDPQLLAALGLDERRAGNDERARKFLEAAAKAEVERPRAYWELARLRLDEAKAKPGGAEGKLGEAQVAHVLTPLMTARKQRPPMATVYGLVAEVWMRSARGPTKEEFGVVLEGVQTFPRSGGLVLQATMLAAAHNFPKEGLILAKHGQRIAKAADRARFDVLVNAFERDEAPATAAPGTRTAPVAPKEKESYLPKLP